MTGVLSNVLAGCFAMAAFAVAILAGLAVGNSPASILLRALIAMIVCYPVGLMIGLAVQRVVSDQLEAQQKAIDDEDEAKPVEASATEQSAENAEDAEDLIVV
ncbi:MAG: hypothetical protein IH830_08820 [Planctomycetes bacterium]|nr:hypothetical protein [Planctomycetota bacterium]